MARLRRQFWQRSAHGEPVQLASIERTRRSGPHVIFRASARSGWPGMSGCGTGVALTLHSGGLAWLHDEVAVGSWTGREARALRVASRLTVRGFAEQLGVAPRTVSKWEAGGAALRPLPVTQQILDTFLTRADQHVRQRYHDLTAQEVPMGPSEAVGGWDLEAWVDDLDRVVACLARQEFTAAGALLGRWPTSNVPPGADPAMLYLCGRGLMLVGDLRRDQGMLSGPGSAATSYRQARQISALLGSARRTAQADLALAVVAEMRGEVVGAARAYRLLAADDRLARRDRARALLWVGTAVDKHGDHATANSAMSEAITVFESLDEAADWCVAQQKLALAARNAGRLDTALWHIGLAVEQGADETPLQQVRLSTARGHILMTDPASRAEGTRLLSDAERLAVAHGLGHQLRAIHTIRTSVQENRTA